MGRILALFLVFCFLHPVYAVDLPKTNCNPTLDPLCQSNSGELPDIDVCYDRSTGQPTSCGEAQDSGAGIGSVASSVGQSDPNRQVEDDAVKILMDAWRKAVDLRMGMIADARKQYPRSVANCMLLYSVGSPLLNDCLVKSHDRLLEQLNTQEAAISELNRIYSESIANIRRPVDTGQPPSDPGYSGSNTGAGGAAAQVGGGSDSGSNTGAGGAAAQVGGGSDSGSNTGAGGAAAQVGGGSDSGSNTGVGGAAGKDGKDGDGISDFCKNNPKALICSSGDGQSPDAVINEVSIPSVDNGILWRPDFFMPRSGVCPQDKTFNLMGRSFTLGYGNICAFLEIIRPIVIGFSMLMAGFLVFNSLRSH